MAYIFSIQFNNKRVRLRNDIDLINHLNSTYILSCLDFHKI